jgi:hypothetical protein
MEQNHGMMKMSSGTCNGSVCIALTAAGTFFFSRNGSPS